MVYTPKAILAHLLSTVTASTPIVCGGLITHIASQLPDLGFRDSTPISPLALISIPFLKHAKDILAHDTRNGVKIYQWNLYPNPTNVVLFLPALCINNRLSEKLHYCLPGALPNIFVTYASKAKRRQARKRESRDCEEESQEEEESEEEGEKEEAEEQQGARSARPNQPGHPE